MLVYLLPKGIGWINSSALQILIEVKLHTCNVVQLRSGQHNLSAMNTTIAWQGRAGVGNTTQPA